LEVDFGLIRSFLDNPDPELSEDFYGELRQVVSNPYLMDCYFAWLEASIGRRLSVCKYVKNVDEVIGLLPFFEFEDFLVNKEFLDLQRCELRSRVVDFFTGEGDLGMCLSQNTEVIRCFGFSEKDVDGLVSALNNYEGEIKDLKFIKSEFPLEMLREVNHLYNGSVLSLGLDRHNDMFVNSWEIESDVRFNWLQDVRIRKLNLNMVYLSSMDAVNITEMIRRNNRLEEVGFEASVINPFEFVLRVVSGFGEAGRLKKVSFRGSNFDIGSLDVLVKSGFLSECFELNLTRCGGLNRADVGSLDLDEYMPNLEVVYLD
jgi:hypothetical protein